MARMCKILFSKNGSQARTCDVFAAIERGNRCAYSNGGDPRESRCYVWTENTMFALWWLGVRREGVGYREGPRGEGAGFWAGRTSSVRF
jgi:hypothetical protein